MPDNQAIKIDALGRIMSEHREDSPVDLSQFGPQSITRFSEVLFHEASQLWYIQFRDGAPEKYRGQNLTCSMARHAGVPDDAYAKLLQTADAPDWVPGFTSYSGAVEVEREVLRWMMRTGKFHELPV